MDQYISRETLVHFLDHELGADEDVFEKLFEHLDQYLHDIKNAKDQPSLQGPLAHKAKSGCFLFGAKKLFDQLAELETIARTNNFEAQRVAFLTAEAMIAPTLNEIRLIAIDFFKGVKKSA